MEAAGWLQSCSIKVSQQQQQGMHDYIKLWRGRELLRWRRLVACLHGHRVVDASPWEACAQEMQAAQGAPPSVARVMGDVDVYWHIGAHSFNPCTSTFKPLDFKGEWEEHGVRYVLLEAHGA